MYRFLLTPRWLALHVLVLVLIPAFVLLGRWQFGRFAERSDASTKITANLGTARLDGAVAEQVMKGHVAGGDELSSDVLGVAV